MAVPCVRLALLLCLMIPATVASPRSLRKSPANASASRPTAFFEVDRPPRGGPGRRCSTLLMSASFGSTFDKPPATAAYSPPRCLLKAGGRASAISLAVLEWRAACRGPQLDRIFGVWLGGAELLRGSTAAPPPNGIVWSVSKDVTKYASLLAAAGNSTFAVYLGNLVNATLTGVYHANVTLHLYIRRTPTTKPPPAMAPADLIVPMSRPLPLNGGLWFPIQSAADVASKSVALPSNTYRAVLELYFSFHEDDELWYKNQPGYQNGPFREVTARVDAVLAGSVCPFPVIYPGGIHPLLWRPIAPIGSFNLPTYDIELTPFLGKLLDGKAHEFAFAVTNAVGVWYVGANLHLWLDPGGTSTTAGLICQLGRTLDQWVDKMNTRRTNKKENGSGNSHSRKTPSLGVEEAEWTEEEEWAPPLAMESKDEEGGGKSWDVRQTYRYNATDGCYFRNVTSSNYNVVSDHSNEFCVKGAASAGVGAVTAALPAVNLP
uniref:Peptide N-acetyl-beta-D-glucosaminyl asparaginase amidase A N-terminal domain-containing protein n=1 Tax=Aegilops tauschii TaxID=37682 RepID=M8AKI4_AEGTA